MSDHPPLRQVLRDATWAIMLFLAILLVFGFDRPGGPMPQEEPQNLLSKSDVPKIPAKIPSRPPISKSIVATPPRNAKFEAARKPVLKPALSIRGKASAPATSIPHKPLALLEFPAQQPFQKLEKKVEFFSIKAKAQSVVFVVDCSGSMAGRRFERACLELAISIIRLQPNQQFYVVFFNNRAIPMFNTSLPVNLQAASTSMKIKATQWMLTIIPGDGTEPEGALQIAAGLKPDVIFLLSDGEFAPLSPSLLEGLQQQKTIVNALAFEDPEGGKLLADIAAKTGGAYRFVPTEGAPATNLADLSSLLTDQLINELRDSNAETRRQAHSTLVEMAGKDLGPAAITNDRDLKKAVERWVQWGRNRLLPLFARADDESIVAHLQSPGRITRWAAASVVERRRLYVPQDLIASLKGADRETTQVIRTALTHLSNGMDYGPAEDATDEARSKAVARWTRWAQGQNLVRGLAAKNREVLLAALKSTNPVERWAAVMALRQRKVEALRELLELFRDADEDVRAEARSALVSIAGRSDLGPHLPEQPGRYIPDELLTFVNDRNADARDESQQALALLCGTSNPVDWDLASRRASPDAIARWKTWWTKKKEKRAAIQLRQAKKLREVGNKEAADKRLKAIVETLPGTPSAEEAQRLLVR
jgi:HEAT repeat protein